MRYGLLYLLTFTVLFLGCSESYKEKKRAKKLNYQIGLFNLAHCFTDNESNISFPISFNDSIIRQNGIKEIKRYYYSNDRNLGSEDLKEVRTYTFSKNGKMLSLSIKQIYEYAEVGEIIFDYPDGVDEFGFGEVKINKKSNLDVSKEHFNIYQKEQYSKKYLVYSHLNSGDYLFYMKNEENWGGVSVDSILHPTPKDIIVYGLPKKPSKIYQVDNRVNEFNVTTAEYVGDEHAVSEMLFNKYPFTYHRSFIFEKKGKCSTFIDSTFSGEQYLMRRLSNVVRDSNNLPIRVNHENQVTENNTGYREYEKFEYEFFKESK